MNRLTGLIFLMLTGGFAIAQPTLEKPHNYVVVIGAFSIRDHADHFVDKAKKQNMTPQVELNRVRSLYYVFVGETDDREVAIKEANKLREEGTFKDAWVFFDGTHLENKPAQDIHPVTQEPIVPVVQPPVGMVLAKEPEPEPIPVKVDSAKLKDDHIKAQVAAKDLNMKKGEVERLDYIYFYKDAAVLRPESKYEVDRLVTIMKKNPTEKIRIHGHTNGNSPGKIIKRNNQDSDFFSLDNTVEDYGSAKELSELRANLIREYLIANGIEKKRMEIKAWGGKKPLYDINADKAEANVRVEIEVLK